MCLSHCHHLCAAVLLLIALAATPLAAQADPAVDVLMISGNANQGQIGPATLAQPGWRKFKASCAGQGVRVHILGEGNSSFEELTPELFAKFQVVLVAGAPHTANTPPARLAQGEEFLRRMDAYQKSGGGLIFVPFGHDHDPKYWTDAFGKRYDARALEEKLYDPQRLVHVNPLYKSWRCDYFWTKNIAEHPVTAGMRGLLLPRHGDYDHAGTVPMQFGKSWTVLIRGADTASTIGFSEITNAAEGAYRADLKGSWEHAPEVVAVREGQAGAGRMMVFPFHPAHTWANFNSWVLNDAMMLKGWDAMPSDGMKLFINGCRWLAEPARAKGLGGYQPPKEIVYAEVPPVDWHKADWAPNSWSGMGAWFNTRTQLDNQMDDLVTPTARDFRGILGARTALGDGHGTVAEYAAAAKKLGLSFIVFLEDLEKIDDARFARLREDCRAASNADFRALAGYLCRDTLGVQYYIFNTVALPQPDQLTPERRVKAPNDLIICGNNYASGGIAGLASMKIDPYFLLSYFTIAAYTYDNGKLVDDGLAVYRSLQGRLHHMTPVSLTIVRSPNDLAATVAGAHTVVYHAADLSFLEARLGPQQLWNPNPIYITAGPAITRWGTLNPIGQPYAPGKQRVRFALEARSDDGIAEVRIIEARTGKVFRLFKPNGAKEFACTIDETHKDQWYLIPLVTDVKGRTALGPTIETFQDGNRVSAYMDNIDSGHRVIGWDEQHQKLMQWGGWMVPPFHKGAYHTGDMPPNTYPDELAFHGVDGGSIGGGHCEIYPQAVINGVTEPKIAAYYFENWLASFDNVIGNYAADGQFVEEPYRMFPGCNWISSVAGTEPNRFVDIHARVEAVRARYHAPLSVNMNRVEIAFKQDGTLSRVNLVRTFNRVQADAMYVTGRDQEGMWSVLDDDAKNKFTRNGTLAAGDYIFLGSDYAGAPAVINLEAVPLSYSYANQHLQVFYDGKNRPVKIGEKITVRFLIVTRPWEGQNNSAWLSRFIADYAVGGGKPAYEFNVSQGKVAGVNYTLNLEAQDGGAALEVKKHPLPHNLLVKVIGIAANAVAGRYDTDQKQLLILPVYEQVAATSVNTTLGDTRLYVGELFRCNDDQVLLSGVQDGADKLMLEIHNPTAKPRTVSLTPAPGFAPLAGLNVTVVVPPFASVKKTFVAAKGSLVDASYHGD